MKYVFIEWIHNFPDEPVEIYAELDDERNEVRKIELFRNGEFGFSSPEIEFGGTYIAEASYPEIEVISDNIEFKAREITKEQFEQIWSHKTTVFKIIKREITFDQRNVLIKDVLPPRSDLISWIQKGQLKNDKWEVVIPSEIAEAIRDICLRNQQLTEHARRQLKDLSDIFYGGK